MMSPRGPGEEKEQLPPAPLANGPENPLHHSLASSTKLFTKLPRTFQVTIWRFLSSCEPSRQGPSVGWLPSQEALGTELRRRMRSEARPGRRCACARQAAAHQLRLTGFAPLASRQGAQRGRWGRRLCSRFGRKRFLKYPPAGK